MAPNDRVIELRSSDRPRRGGASNDGFGSVKVTGTEAIINGVFRHPGRLILQIGDALPETELSRELQLPVGSFAAEISYVNEDKDTNKERLGVVMRVAKAEAAFEKGEYMAVGTPLQPMDLAQDGQFRFRETSDGLVDPRDPNKIVFADVLLRNGSKIPVSLIAVPNVHAERTVRDSLIQQIEALLARFRNPHDPESIETGRWAALVERVRTYKGHESIEIDALYADDSRAAGITTPVRHEDGHTLAIRIFYTDSERKVADHVCRRRFR